MRHNLQSLHYERPRYDTGMPPTGHTVSPERLEEFRAAYQKVYGEEITLLEATEMTHRLLTLYQLLGQPSRNDEGERVSPSPPRPDSESP